jgi:hypothetical protein
MEREGEREREGEMKEEREGGRERNRGREREKERDSLALPRQVSRLDPLCFPWTSFSSKLTYLYRTYLACQLKKRLDRDRVHAISLWLCLARSDSFPKVDIFVSQTPSMLT